MEKNNHLNGVGGWLAALIAIYFLASLLSVGITADQWRSSTSADLGHNYFRNHFFSNLFTSAVVLYATFLLAFVKNRRSVWWGIVGAWVGWTGQGLLKGLLFLEATGEMSSEFFKGLAIMIAASVLFTAYLIRSARVKNTYGSVMQTGPSAS